MKTGIQGIIKNDKKKSFYFRGHLKQHNIDLNKHEIDVKKATNYFDDEEEIRNAKTMVKNILRPSKKKFGVEINQKVFGMTPMQFQMYQARSSLNFKSKYDDEDSCESLYSDKSVKSVELRQ